MRDIIKKKEIKGILMSILLIVLGVFLIIKPLEIVNTLIKVIGVILLLIGVFDFGAYFKASDEDKIFNYGLFKGILEFCVGIMFIFKVELLTELFSTIIGLIIVIINIFKLELAINTKEIDEKNWYIGAIISTLSIILGIVIILNPFDTVKLVVITSGIILLVSEISNIIYSIMILLKIRKMGKVIKEIDSNEMVKIK